MRCQFNLIETQAHQTGLFRCLRCGDSLALPLASGAKVARRCPATPPSLLEQAGNLAGALLSSAATGFATVNEATLAKRQTACDTCLRFLLPATGTCSHPQCGCGVSGPQRLIDKRRLASSTCPVGRWHRPQWISSQQRIADTRTLMDLLPLDTAAIIGVARSGLAPATEIAMQLHLPLFILDDVAQTITPAGHGWRLRTAQTTQMKAGPWICIDDSHASGRSRQRGLDLCQQAPLTRGKQIYWGVVYTNPETQPQPDFSAVVCTNHHLFEWNFPNSVYGPQTAWDIDGAIVTEPPRPHGKPFLVPRRGTVPLIVTGRYETERAATEAQLRALGVRWQRLEMFPGSSAERDEPLAISRHKARHYQASECNFFAESCPIQAREIAGLTGKIVICPATGEVF